MCLAKLSEGGLFFKGKDQMSAPFPCADKALFDLSHWDFSTLFPRKRHLHIRPIRHTSEARYSYVMACDGKCYQRANEDTGVARAGELLQVDPVVVFGPEKL